MKSLITLTLAIFLTACASTPQQQAGEQSQPQSQQSAQVDNKALAQEMVAEMIRGRMAANGERLLCEQPAYVGCFNITVDQCIAETAPLKAKCIETASKKAGDLNNNESMKQFGAVFAMCMGMNHMFLHSSNAQEIGACMKTAKFDQGVGMQSLLGK